ncbi:MAG: tRNA (guanosine(46)-N7)-methyltransferase TrmB [Gammaproteobacteria bacterium]
MIQDDDDTRAVRRAVRSYVLRAGRMTAAQARALDTLMPRYGLTVRDLGTPRASFARPLPLHFEIGIGNGENLLAMAVARPDRAFIGCEVHRPGLGHLLNRLDTLGLDNLRVVEADAWQALAALPDASLAGAYMFFPDPWPKKRHHKRRLLSQEFLALLAGKCAPQACFFFASDDADYAEQARTTLAGAPAWLNLAGNAAWAPRPRRRIVTRFEARARRAGRAVYELVAARAPSTV